MGRLVASQLRSHPLRILPAAVATCLALISPAAGNLRPRLNRWTAKLALRGLSQDGYRRLARSLGAKLGREERFRNNPLISHASELIAAGPVTVVTASEHTLARAYLNAVGLRRVQLCASEVGMAKGQLQIATHNIGASKIDALVQTGVDVSACTFYTDSASDLPIARLCPEVILVRASHRSRRIYRRELASTTSEWTGPR